MQWNTLVKLGSLAVDVAQNDTIQELAGLVHKGAVRRGIIPAPPKQPTKEPVLKEEPKKETAKKGKKEQTFFLPYDPKAPLFPTGTGLGKIVAGGNTKKALQIASTLTKLMLK